jgi:glutamine synthetase
VKPKAVLAYCREKGIKAFDLRFADVLGRWRHITFPVSALTEAAFEEGFGHEIVLDQLPSHSILVPQASAHYLDPFTPQPTLILLASVQDAVMREESALDSRHVASQALRYLETTSIGDGVSVRASSQFQIHRNEPQQHTSRDENTLHICGPSDRDFELRCQVADVAAESGLQIERHFSGPCSSSEMVLKSASLLECCDNLLMLRYLIGQSARASNQSVSERGLWLPSQWTILRNGESIFVGSAYRGLSETGLHAMGGILNHADAIAAIALSNTPDVVAMPWLKLCSSNAAKSICRTIIASNNPRDRAIEFRGAPASCNPYFVYSAVLMAMIDGIQNKTSPGAALEKTLSPTDDDSSYRLGAEAGRPYDRQLLKECLISDSDFLCRGEVFTTELIESFCNHLSFT